MSDAQNTLQMGIDAIRSGDKEAARAAFRRVLQDDPDNVQALLWLAGVTNTREEKQDVLQRVLELDPDNTLARTGLNALGADPNTQPAVPPITPDRPSTTAEDDSAPRSAQDSAAENDRSRRRLRRTAAAGTGAAATRRRPVARETLVLGKTNEKDEEGGSRFTSLLWMILAPLLLLAVAFGTWYASQNNIGPFANAGNNTVAGSPAASADPNPEATEATASAAYPDPQTTESAEGIAGAEITSTTTIAIPGVVANAGQVPGEEASPSPEASPLPVPAASPTPTSSATAAPAPTPQVAAPPSSPNTAGNGQIRLLDTGQKLQAGIWEWSYYGRSNYTTGSGYSVQPSNGRYLIVLLLVRNTSDAPVQIPDGLFVVTDDQGRSISFNRPISVEYMRRYGSSAGDYPANAAIPVTNTPVSVPLLFDVAADATNLVITSTSDPGQGYLVRSNMR